MAGWLGEWYLWVKALHIVAVIAWMAGMLYLPRLYVYHVGAPAGSDQAKTFEIMEQRLLRAIMNPSMIGVWVLGVMLFLNMEGWRLGWMHGKLLLVIALTGFHHLLGVWRKQLAAGTCTKSARFFRIVNELPALAMIVVVILVVVQPF